MDDYDDQEMVPFEYFGNGTEEIPDSEDVSYHWQLNEDK